MTAYKTPGLAVTAYRTCLISLSRSEVERLDAERVELEDQILTICQEKLTVEKTKEYGAKIVKARIAVFSWTG